MKTTSELRELFQKYFEENAHRRVRSHSLIPPADPTLLFVNAGMVQFKDVFVGVKKVDYSRATSSQKCLRVSGKHNDLENVGRTARHHTFFEMLGNFSFGDYFKKDAIRFAYEFLVDRVGMDPTSLYYTVFGGDEADGLGVDEEAAGYWREVAGVGDDRILKFGKKDNFWAMGETGPCGPCSEILVDRGPGPWACGLPTCAPGCDCDRYMEVWNLVFMQYERKEPGGPLMPLPKPSIDTGMGLERLAAIVQKKPTNYETDAFLPIIHRTCELFLEHTGKPVVYGKDGETDVALRVIADHARAAAFLIADGVYPDNEGRGYIARLLMRRAVRFGRKMGFAAPFFHQVCDYVVTLMSDAYPELSKARELIRKVGHVEEDSFGQTFDDGRRRLEEEIERLKALGKSEVGGEFLFVLHDERGFQPDLVDLIAGESGFSIDKAGYERLMEKKRQDSANLAQGGARESQDELRKLLEQHGPTGFLAYESESDEATVLATLSKGVQKSGLTAGDEGDVVLTRSPFYGESGGQIGDTGELLWDGGRAVVLDTQKVFNALLVHKVRVETGALKPNQLVVATVDHGRRSAIRAHHSATHLLHWALEKVLGSHIKQEGSLVRDDLLRFDFRHFSPMSPEEVETIETLVAGKVIENSPVDTQELGIEDAMKLGAKAFFDEKYGERVRVVSMGGRASRELCGGTHVAQTGDIGLLRIVKQEAVSAGVRRIYAVCHLAGVAALKERDRQVTEMMQTLRCQAEELPARLQRLLERNSELEKQVTVLERKLLQTQTGAGAAGQTEVEIRGEKLAMARLDEVDNARLREMADLLRDRIGKGLVLVGGTQGGKLLFVVASTSDSKLGIHCGKLVQSLAQLAGGRGGGKPEFGQAGGGDISRWDEIAAAFIDQVKGA